MIINHSGTWDLCVQKLITILMQLRGENVQNQMSPRGIRYRYLAICPGEVATVQSANQASPNIFGIKRGKLHF